MTQVDAAAKIKVLLPNYRPSESRKISNIETLVLIDITVVVGIEITIVVVMMDEF